MEMQGYLALARRRWWLLIAGPALAVVVAFYVTQQITPSYRSQAQLLVTNLKTVDPAAAALATPTSGLDLGLNGLQVDERLTNTYVNLVKRRPVLDAVIARLALPMTSDDLADKISVSSVKDTQIIVLSVEDTDPAVAATIANATAEEFVNTLGVQLGQTGSVSIAEQATAATDPFKPSLMTNIMLAIVLGGIVAAAVAVGLEYVDDTIKEPEDLEPLGLTSLGEISKFSRSAKGDDSLVVSDFNSRPAEAYRQLRTNIRFAGIGGGLKMLVVTSAHPGEGKSTTAANLAAALAQAGDRVILVDADLRRSSLRKTFEGPASFGLTGLLYNDLSDPSVALVATRWKNLRILPAGTLPPNPSELLTSKRMVRVMDSLKNLADYVIFDTPPVLAVTDATVLAARTDGTIFVAEAGKTRSSALRESARLLQQANVRIAGVVLNRAKGDRAGYYHYSREEIKDGVEVEADVVRKPSVQPATSRSITPQPVEPADDVRPAAVGPQRVVPSQVPSRLTPAASNGNGHSNGNGYSNGNGNGNGHYVPARVPEPVLAGDHFEETMAGLLSRMGDTMGMIRSLKPDGKNEPPGGL